MEKEITGTAYEALVNLRALELPRGPKRKLSPDELKVEAVFREHVEDLTQLVEREFEEERAISQVDSPKEYLGTYDGQKVKFRESGAKITSFAGTITCHARDGVFLTDWVGRYARGELVHRNVEIIAGDKKLETFQFDGKVYTNQAQMETLGCQMARLIYDRMIGLARKYSE